MKLFVIPFLIKQYARCNISSHLKVHCFLNSKTIRLENIPFNGGHTSINFYINLIEIGHPVQKLKGIVSITSYESATQILRSALLFE